MLAVLQTDVKELRSQLEVLISRMEAEEVPLRQFKVCFDFNKVKKREICRLVLELYEQQKIEGSRSHLFKCQPKSGKIIKVSLFDITI